MSVELDTERMIVYRINNNIDNKCYIGISIRTFNERYNNQWWKYSCNKYLKNAVNKFGKENFSISILHKQVKDQKTLFLLEKEEAIKNNSYYPNGYNFLECGESDYHKHYDGKYSEKEYLLLSPNNTIYRIKNLSKFCREMGLKEQHLYKIAANQKNRKSYKGWRSATNEENYEYEFYNIFTDEILKFENKFKSVSDFQKKTGIKDATWNRLIYGDSLLTETGWIPVSCIQIRKYSKDIIDYDSPVFEPDYVI